MAVLVSISTLAPKQADARFQGRQQLKSQPITFQLRRLIAKYYSSNILHINDYPTS